MELGLLILRVVIGALFVGHGAQKLFGAFGGHGLKGTAGFFESIGLRPGRAHATAAGMSELAGGALLALGLITPLAAVLLIATMTAAIVTVHASKGVWVSDGGYEYNVVLAAVAFAVAAIGPGPWSLDRALGLTESGAGWALGALALGLAGGIGAVVSGRLQERDERGAGGGSEVHAT
ncbi:MAG TPA: DoxX family protein [Thermoleophilaceae bacterium]|jgi:putative oxidoreductase